MIGWLLVAGPQLFDPNFFRTVVLLCGHDDDGALGLVLNRPTGIPVGDHLPGWVERLDPPEVVFVGGPVEPDVAIGLGRRKEVKPRGWSPVIADVGLVDLTLPPGEVAGDLIGLRVFSGYAGWGAGQLEEELATGDWVLAASIPDDAFGPAVDGLWRTVLRRRGGGPALYADFPLDPRVN